MTQDESPPLVKHREHLVEARHKAYEDYDKALIALSSGALGLSIAFKKDFVGDSALRQPGLLIGAWVLWTLTILATVYSFRVSHRALKVAIDEVDAPNEPRPHSSAQLSATIETINTASGYVFVLGVVMLVAFAILNLSATHGPEEKIKRQDQEQRKGETKAPHADGAEPIVSGEIPSRIAGEGAEAARISSAAATKEIQVGPTSESRPAPATSESLTEYWSRPVFGHRLRITDSLLVVFTALLFIVGAVQSSTMISQITLARREFIQTHRPQLALRRITFDGNANEPLPSPPRVKIELANIGGVGAISVEAHIAFGTFATGLLIPWVILEELERSQALKIVAPYAGSAAIVATFPPERAKDFATMEVRRGDHSVYCIGYVTYSDMSSAHVRRLGFVRRCDAVHRWFDKVENADFEYAD